MITRMSCLFPNFKSGQISLIHQNRGKSDRWNWRDMRCDDGAGPGQTSANSWAVRPVRSDEVTPSPPSLRLTVTSLFLSHLGQRKVNEAVSLQLLFSLLQKQKADFWSPPDKQVFSPVTHFTLCLYEVLLHIVLMPLIGVKVNVTHFCTN